MNIPSKNVFRGVQYPDYKSYRTARDAIEKKELEAAKAKVRKDLKPMAKEFRIALQDLCKTYGVVIDYASDDSSDWYGITGFELGFTFKASNTFFPLED